MKKEMSQWAVAAMLAGSVLVGCNKEEPTVTPPAKTEMAPAAKSATSMPAMVGKAMESAMGTMDAAKVTALKDATAKLDEITGLIKDKKFDLAESGLKKLEENKGALPEALQGKLPEIRMALDAARKMNGAVKAPELPATPEIPKTSDLPKTPELPGLNK